MLLPPNFLPLLASSGSHSTHVWGSIGTSRPPLAYAPLSSLATAPSQPDDDPALRLLLSTAPEHQLDLLASSDGPDDARSVHFARTALGLLHLHRAGAADVCHDLVTPLSWGEATPFGLGPPLLDVADPVAVALSTYAHVFVHRWEGFRVGEFNMVGYDNANFWGRATLSRSDSGRAVPFAEVRESVRSLSEKYGDPAKAWFADWIAGDLGPETTGACWDPRALNELCRAVDRGDPGAGGEGYRYAELADFCREACAAECDAVLRRCLREAGCDGPAGPGAAEGGEGGEFEKVDADVALRAGRFVSSAHIDKYRSGSVLLRSVARTYDAASASAGVATRLLECPAVRQVRVKSCVSEDFCGGTEAVAIYVDNGREEDVAVEYDLSVGDALAIRIDLTLSAVQNFKGNSWRIYVPCAVDIDGVAFVDRLYGTRGNTPTTVIQWSKGTAFYKDSEDIPMSRSE